MLKRTKTLQNDIFVFAPNSDGLVVARRSASPVSNFFDILSSTDEAKFICSLLNSFSTFSILVIADGRPALISTAFYPSSGLLVAVQINANPRTAYTLAKYGSLGNVQISPAYCNIKENDKISTQETEALFCGYSDLAKLVGRSRPIGVNQMNYTAFTSLEYAKTVADVVGCRIDMASDLPIGVFENYDFSLYSVFILCSAMLLRRASNERCGKISFFPLSLGLAVQICSDFPKGTVYSELEALQKRVKPLNMYFSIIEKDGLVHIEFCPQRPELSKLGLKDSPTLKG